MQWTPSTITYTIDGRVWARVSVSSLRSGTQWPDIPMNLTLQSQNQDSAQPSGTIETMTVAWVAEYAMKA
ncbi:MAG TPA: family 16 glycosylhydrolase [Streptosporangiaceae bacterium]|nr:family 16 glycosylhydrolase [Streptosporangiaceae bacterium]